MSKEAYFEMCEMLGTEPVEEDIPLSLGDLSFQSQLALEVYNYLPENWAQTAYLGKNLNGITELFEILDIHGRYQRLLIIKFIKVIDRYVSERIEEKTKQELRRKN
jgi:hypothetical protein